MLEWFLSGEGARMLTLTHSLGLKAHKVTLFVVGAALTT